MLSPTARVTLIHCSLPSHPKGQNRPLVAPNYLRTTFGIQRFGSTAKGNVTQRLLLLHFCQSPLNNFGTVMSTKLSFMLLAFAICACLQGRQSHPAAVDNCR